MAIIERKQRNGTVYQVLVDDDDMPRLSACLLKVVIWDGKWCYCEVKPRGGPKWVSIHRFLLDPPKGVMVDHRNGNALDNRRENLRLCNNSRNQANRHARRGMCPYKGVTRITKSQRWFAQIKVNGRSFYLGSFDDPRDAAMAYDKAAMDRFGEFANINFPSTPSEAPHA